MSRTSILLIISPMIVLSLQQIGVQVYVPWLYYIDTHCMHSKLLLKPIKPAKEKMIDETNWLNYFCNIRQLRPIWKYYETDFRYHSSLVLGIGYFELILYLLLSLLLLSIPLQFRLYRNVTTQYFILKAL